jgi:hypothetical protein
VANPVPIQWICPAGSTTMAGLPMPFEHRGLSEEDVIACGGWHRGYARVLAVASDGDYGFAVVDGNGDGAELPLAEREEISRGQAASRSWPERYRTTADFSRRPLTRLSR